MEAWNSNGPDFASKSLPSVFFFPNLHWTQFPKSIFDSIPYSFYFFIFFSFSLFLLFMLFLSVKFCHCSFLNFSGSLRTKDTYSQVFYELVCSRKNGTYHLLWFYIYITKIIFKRYLIWTCFSFRAFLPLGLFFKVNF